MNINSAIHMGYFHKLKNFKIGKPLNKYRSLHEETGYYEGIVEHIQI